MQKKREENQLTTNIRPATLAVLVAVLVGVVAANGLGADFDPAVLELFKFLAGLVFAFYFIGRSCEKGLEIYEERKHGGA